MRLKFVRNYLKIHSYKDFNTKMVLNRIAELVPEADFICIDGSKLQDQQVSSNITVTDWEYRDDALSIAKSLFGIFSRRRKFI